ncbi:MAG: serine/threonine protein kinase [Planctomycetes bacterium]|nr:serine/threonine protein kinase [Planctomycetota bacterium]
MASKGDDRSDRPRESEVPTMPGEGSPSSVPIRGTSRDDLEKSPESIGPYRILECLGRGGMGVVYLAEQKAPVNRRVAVKLLKLGMDSQELIARFEAERQALAMIGHPNVAAVFDAGTTDSGRPYFVMEYVPGVPITEYCDENCLSTTERLQLFIPVCLAVQHAHQRGIIHRDIKPSNVLVMLQDGEPVPKIIDFGVAKALDHRLGETPHHTRHDQLVGTLPYMSPEQAECSPLDIDTRTDVYSLGVLLYELLVGVLPFEIDLQLRARSRDGRRTRTDTEPTKPSARITTLSGTTKHTAENRRTDLRSLARQLRGDLDWIALKALAKDRTRRYATASELAADLARHLHGEPVTAGPPSASYRLKKLATKHKGAVVAAAAVVLALVGGLVVSTRLYVRAESAKNALTKALDASDLARTKEEKARQLADEEKSHAQYAEKEAKQAAELSSSAREEAVAEAEARKQEAAKARAIRDVFIERMLLAVDPARDGRDVKVVDMLNKIASDVDHEPMDDRPEIEAFVRNTLGRAYYKLGLYEIADPHFRRAVSLRRKSAGDDDAETADSMNDLAATLFAEKKWPEAEKTLRACLDIERRILPADDPATVQTLNNLSQVLRADGRLAEAQEMIRQVVDARRRAVPRDDRAFLTSLNNLACGEQDLGNIASAESLFRELITARSNTFGPQHPDTLVSMHNLGHLLVSGTNPEKVAEGEALLRKTIEGRRTKLGPSHPQTLQTMALLANSLEAGGNAVEAEKLYRECLKIWRESQSELDPARIEATHALARFLFDKHEWTESEGLFREALDLCRRHGDGMTKFVLQLTIGDGGCLFRMKRFEDAEALLLRVDSQTKDSPDADLRPVSYENLREMAELYDAWGKPEKARECDAKLPPDQQRSSKSR